MKLPAQLALALLSAALMPLCFPPFGWWPLVLLVFPLLLLATTNTAPRRAFYLGLLQGTVGYGATLSWLFHIFGRAAIPLFGIIALFTALFCLALNFLEKRISSPGLKVLLAATLWTAIEFYRAELFFLRFPWITPGAALGPTFLSPLLGVYAATFLVVATSAGFLHRRTAPLACFMALCVIGLGFFRPGLVEPDPKASLTVTVLQDEDCMLPSYVLLTRTAHKEAPDLIVWPECSLPYDVRQHDRDFAVLTNLCAQMNAVLVLGTRTVVGAGDRDWYNTALTLDKHGTLGEYYKARPVHFFNDGIAGRNFAPIHTRLGAMGTPICFDCDYSDVARKIVARGAEYFAVPSFDAESWSANQHLQHALLFRLRAAENARWFACAASSGVSQFIDPHGNVRTSLPPMKSGTLTYRIGKSRNMTFFDRVGWLFPWLTVACSALLLVFPAVRHVVANRRA